MQGRGGNELLIYCRETDHYTRTRCTTTARRPGRRRGSDRPYLFHHLFAAAGLFVYYPHPARPTGTRKICAGIYFFLHFFACSLAFNRLREPGTRSRKNVRTIQYPFFFFIIFQFFYFCTSRSGGWFFFLFLFFPAEIGTHRRDVAGSRAVPLSCVWLLLRLGYRDAYSVIAVLN